MKPSHSGGPLHCSRSPFVNLVISLFHVLSLEQTDSKRSGSAYEHSEPPNASSQSHANHYTSPFPPGMSADHVAKLVSQDIAESKRQGFYTGTDKTRSQAVVPSVAASRQRRRTPIRSALAALFTIPIALPIGVAAMLTVFGSLGFMGVVSSRLWSRTMFAVGVTSEYLALMLAILLGGSLVVGLLLGRVVLRPLERLGLIGEMLAVLLPLAVCVPIIVNAWWYPLPSLANYLLSPLSEVLGAIPYAEAAIRTDALSAVRLSLVGLGWGSFIGQLR